MSDVLESLTLQDFVKAIHYYRAHTGRTPKVARISKYQLSMLCNQMFFERGVYTSPEDIMTIYGVRIEIIEDGELCIE